MGLVLLQGPSAPLAVTQGIVAHARSFGGAGVALYSGGAPTSWLDGMLDVDGTAEWVRMQALSGALRNLVVNLAVRSQGARS
jgi:hypothetical protein